MGYQVAERDRQAGAGSQAARTVGQRSVPRQDGLGSAADQANRGGAGMYAKGQALIQLMEEYAPKSYAVEDDKIGLQIGTLNKEIRKVLTALDVTDEVVDEAIREQADLIIAHHAVIFRPL